MKLTKEQLLQKARELRETADRMDSSLNPTASMSSEEWVSPERHIHVRERANKARQEAAMLEAEANR